jgi:hypothetical protein
MVMGVAAVAALHAACGHDVVSPSALSQPSTAGEKSRGAVAHAGSGPIPDNGTHYNLNIIGVPHDKTVPDMTGSNRHVIFVPLESGADVARQVSVFYVAGDQFRVLDGNATNDNVATIMVPSEPAGDLCYNVWATALGKPNGNAVVGAQCVIDGLLGSCTDALLLGGFQLERKKGTPKPMNISDIFRATGCIDLNASGTCDTGDLQFKGVWIFNVAQLLQYFWDYDNNGLKLMQIRFYPTTCGSFAPVGS